MIRIALEQVNFNCKEIYYLFIKNNLNGKVKNSRDGSFAQDADPQLKERAMSSLPTLHKPLQQEKHNRKSEDSKLNWKRIVLSICWCQPPVSYLYSGNSPLQAF